MNREAGGRFICLTCYHHDRLGSTAYLTDNVAGAVASFTGYDDYGAPTMKTIIRLGSRELDLAAEYTGHPYDPILGVYYARARMYDASARRFLAVDQIRGTVLDPLLLNRYNYCISNPLYWVDPDGMNLSVRYRMTDSGSNNIDPPAMRNRTPGNAQNSAANAAAPSAPNTTASTPSTSGYVRPTIDDLISDVRRSISVDSGDRVYTTITDPDTYYRILNYLAYYGTQAEIGAFYDAFYNREQIYNPATHLFFLLDTSIGYTYNQRLRALKYFNEYGYNTRDWVEQTGMQPNDVLALSFGYQASAEFANTAEWLQAMIAISGMETAANMSRTLISSAQPYQPPAGQQTYWEPGRTETFYRTMSQDDYLYLQETGRIPATGETFISTAQSYSSGYNGVLVEFQVVGGTTSALQSIGVRDGSIEAAARYGYMPYVSSGWGDTNAYFKYEIDMFNIGLGRGTALDMFNDSIVQFSVIGG